MNEEGKRRIDVELTSVFQGAGLPQSLSVELEEREASVQGLLRRLVETGGVRIKTLLFEEGEEAVLAGLMVVVNDRVFTGTALNREAVELRDRDRVNLLYFVSGG